MIGRMRNIGFLIFAVFCAGPVTDRSAPAKQDRLFQEVAKLEATYGGHLGFMAKDLRTGETLAYNAAERFPTASAIKLPVLAAFFQLVDEKSIDPQTVVTLAKEDMKPGSGVLQFLSSGDRITLFDAVKLMIAQSDNTATNLVLDRLAPTNPEQLSVVNDFMIRKGLTNTRILNRLYSFETKQRTPEALRYGIGVSTPEDMVTLLTALYSKTLVSPPSCALMLEILKNQFYREMIPRFLPAEECQYIEIANKTGSVNETKVDVALILSDRADIALSIFVDKNPDHRGDTENRGTLLGAMVARAVWNYYTGSTGYQQRKVPFNDVDWNTFPGGRWGIYRSAVAPFPHRARKRGFMASTGTFYPYHPHYDDNSVVVVVPDSFKETAEGTNVIVHFHDQLDDNLSTLEKGEMPRAMADQMINAILVLPQGPYRARDSFGGRMADVGGLKHLVDDMLATMKNEKVIKATRLNRMILSAHGWGQSSAASALRRGGLENYIAGVFLFDALPGGQDAFINWLKKGDGILYAAYNESFANEYARFEQSLGGEIQMRLHFTPSLTEPGRMIQTFFPAWLKELGPPWKSAP